MLDDEIPKHKSNKNTRKWCKGKQGKLHDPIWEDNKKYPSNNKRFWLVYRCQICNKELDNWWRWDDYLMSDHDYLQPEIGSREPLKRKANK